MNRTLIIASALALVQLVSIGATTNGVKKARTPEERVARMQELRLRRSGGQIRQPGSSKGAFVVLNAQKRVSGADINAALQYLDERMRVPVKLVAAEKAGVDDIAQQITAAGGSIGVAIVDNQTFPSLLTAPESRWSIINVAKLAEQCSDDKVLASRVKKEILRALAFTAGCAYTTMADPIMRDVIKVRDLDALSEFGYGVEILSKFQNSAPLYGLKPWYETTYREACENGWAPSPTNDVQKRIWDRVHAVPKNPMKIEFDKKAGR